jgi:glutathione S-transferase
MIRIYHLPRARGLRVIWQCEEMALPYEIVPVSFPPNDDYRKRNPMGAIPFLEDEGGVAINESVAMMLYLATKYGPTPMMPAKDDPSLARMMQFLVFGEATLGAWGNVQMGARFFAPDAEKDNWSVRTARDRMVQGFDYSAQILGDNPFIAGKTFTIADISVGYAVGVARAMLNLGEKMPKSLLAYHDRLVQRPAYQRASSK